jgi:copper chaperone CopZ
MKRGGWNIAALALLIALLGIGGPWFARELRSLPNRGALAARSEQRVVTLEIGGMRCEACAASIHGQLSQIAGVSDVDVRVAQERAYVVCAKQVADSALTGAVGRAGPGFMAAVVRK